MLRKLTFSNSLKLLQQISNQFRKFIKISLNQNFDKFSLLSPLASINPLFYNWNKAYIPYCDGTFHQGTRFQPIEYKGIDLYFRGSNNTLTHLDYLNKVMNFYSSSEIIVTGISAGAIAAYIWNNHIYNKALHPEKVTLVLDSGLFVYNFQQNYGNPMSNLKENYLLNLVNSEIKMPLEQCVKDYPTQEECFRSGLIAQYLLSPVFVIQSQYDVYGIIYLANTSCIPQKNPSNLSKCSKVELETIERYRNGLIDIMANFTKIQRNGLWTISCALHGFIQNQYFVNSQDYLIPYQTGLNILSSLTDYLNKRGERIHIDGAKWPDNRGCNGLSSKKLTYE